MIITVAQKSCIETEIEKRSHKKNVLTISACNPKKYKTFPVLFFWFRYRIHDRRWKPLSGAWNCQSNRRCASSWVTGFIHPLLNWLRDVIIIYLQNIDKRIYVYRPMVCVPDRIFTYFRCLRWKLICIMLQLVFQNTLEYEKICRFYK